MPSPPTPQKVELIFHHERVNNGQPLVVETGMNEVAWAYKLNVQRYPTYGGEVIQILSCYVDELTVAGQVRSYEKAEEIYEFFMQYFIIATQGPNAGHGEHFEQVPMVFEYPHRHWVFEIQPMKAPGFRYGREVIAPSWQMAAHIVDTGPDVTKIQELAGKKAEEELAKLGGSLKLSNKISPDSGEPALNPFLAPVVPGVSKFKAETAKEITEGLTHLTDYYHTLLPSFMGGDFSKLVGNIGSKPAFGSHAEGAEAPEELIQHTEGPKTKK